MVVTAAISHLLWSIVPQESLRLFVKVKGNWNCICNRFQLFLLKLYHLVRKELSSNLLAEKIVIISVLLITLPFWLIVNEYPGISIFLILILIFCGYSVYTIYFVVCDLSYTDEYLFIKYRKTEWHIELKQIVQIKVTPYWR